MIYTFKRACYKCGNRKEGCQRACEQKLADDFFYYSYRESEKKRKLLNGCSYSTYTHARHYQDKVLKAYSKNNNHWLDIN